MTVRGRAAIYARFSLPTSSVIGRLTTKLRSAATTRPATAMRLSPSLKTERLPDRPSSYGQDSKG